MAAATNDGPGTRRLDTLEYKHRSLPELHLMQSAAWEGCGGPSLVDGVNPQLPLQSTTGRQINGDGASTGIAWVSLPAGQLSTGWGVRMFGVHHALAVLAACPW